MTTQGPRSHTYEVNAFLRVSAYSEDQIRKFLSEVCGVKKKRLQSGLHLTVYHSRRPIPGLCEGARPLQIIADTLETRFMPLAPGGENPREDIDPQAHPLGIRLTKRNKAIKEIQMLREQISRLETKVVRGTRKQTTAWKSSFGSRYYQAHIALLRPWHKINATLTEIGTLFREELHQIEFDLLQIEERHRVNGKWVVDSSISPKRTSMQAITCQKAEQLKKLLAD